MSRTDRQIHRLFLATVTLTLMHMKFMSCTSAHRECVCKNWSQSVKICGNSITRKKCVTDGYTDQPTNRLTPIYTPFSKFNLRVCNKVLRQFVLVTLVFDRTWPIFKLDWDMIKTISWNKTVASKRVNKVLKKSDLVFDLIWPLFEFDLYITKTNILVKYHEDWNKTVTSRRWTRKCWRHNAHMTDRVITVANL